ncbi:MAG: hypothetical protein AAF614_21535 [Chloroflexota bacterium]
MMQSNVLNRSDWVGTFVVTAVLWLVTALVAFWEILLLRDIGIELYLHYASGSAQVSSKLIADQANVIGQLFVILGAMIAIAIAPGTIDFHYRYFGTPKSWRLFTYIFFFQIIVFILALLI